MSFWNPQNCSFIQNSLTVKFIVACKLLSQIYHNTSDILEFMLWASNLSEQNWNLFQWISILTFHYLWIDIRISFNINFPPYVIYSLIFHFVLTNSSAIPLCYYTILSFRHKKHTAEEENWINFIFQFNDLNIYLVSSQTCIVTSINERK